MYRSRNVSQVDGHVWMFGIALFLTPPSFKYKLLYDLAIAAYHPTPPHLAALGISGKSHPHPLLVAHTSCSVSLPASECGLQQLWPPFPSPKQAYHHEGHLFKADSPLCLWSFQRSTVNFASPFFFFFFSFFFFFPSWWMVIIRNTHSGCPYTLQRN